jgi:lysophospholipase L1-like esterase
MSRIKLLLIGLIVLSLSGCATYSNKKAELLPQPAFQIIPLGEQGKTGPGTYAKNRIAVFDKENIKALQNGTIFLGDSITERYPLAQYYPKMKVINRGIGGDTMGGLKYYGVYERLESTVYNLHPKKIILMIGINDLMWIPSVPLEKKFDQYANLLWTLRKNLPKTEIYCVTTLPVKGKYAKFNGDVIKFNEHGKETALKYNAHWIDAYSLLKDDQGMLNKDYAADAVHLNPAGLTILTNLYNHEVFHK